MSAGDAVCEFGYGFMRTRSCAQSWQRFVSASAPRHKRFIRRICGSPAAAFCASSWEKPQAMILRMPPCLIDPPVRQRLYRGNLALKDLDFNQP